MCFIISDVLVSSVHQLGTWDHYVHHVLFILVCCCVIYNCFLAFLAGASLLMEISTPFLNFFTFFRNREGFGCSHWSVVWAFLLFAVNFIIFRIIVNISVLGYFFDVLYRHHADFSAPETHLAFISLT